MSAFWQLVRRDLALAWKEGGAIGVTLGFYLVVVTMLPLGLGPDLNLLSRIAPGVLWVALLLAALLSLGRLFETDCEDGSLEVLATGPLAARGRGGGQEPGALAHHRGAADAAGAAAGAAAEPAAGGLSASWSLPCWRARRRSASSAPSARR